MSFKAKKIQESIRLEMRNMASTYFKDGTMDQLKGTGLCVILLEVKSDEGRKELGREQPRRTL
jgi:hypothetical protein